MRKSTIGPRRRVGIFIIILAAGRSITSREYTRPRARARSSRSTTPGKIGTPGQETDRLYPFTTPLAQWMRLGTKSTSFRGAGRGFGPADFIKTSSCTRMEIFLPQGNAPNGRRDYCVRCLISSLVPPVRRCPQLSFRRLPEGQRVLPGQRASSGVRRCARRPDRRHSAIVAAVAIPQRTTVGKFAIWR